MHPYWKWQAAWMLFRIEISAFWLPLHGYKIILTSQQQNSYYKNVASFECEIKKGSAHTIGSRVFCRPKVKKKKENEEREFAATRHVSIGIKAFELIGLFKWAKQSGLLFATEREKRWVGGGERWWGRAFVCTPGTFKHIRRNNSRVNAHAHAHTQPRRCVFLCKRTALEPFNTAGLTKKGVQLIKLRPREHLLTVLRILCST